MFLQQATLSVLDQGAWESPNGFSTKMSICEFALFASMYTLMCHLSTESPHDIPFLPGSDMGPGEAKFVGTCANGKTPSRLLARCAHSANQDEETPVRGTSVPDSTDIYWLVACSI